VYAATLRDSDKQVAVKVCCADREQFLCEAKLLEQFRHPNIVKFYSMCVDTEPIYVVLEMMSGGDFLSFLRKDGIHQTQYQLTKFSLDAALGMEYLASQNCLHRNLTARSCLVGCNNEVLKISDFSMCKMAEKRMCSQSKTSRLKNVPVKWIAPEVRWLTYASFFLLYPKMHIVCVNEHNHKSMVHKLYILLAMHDVIVLHVIHCIHVTFITQLLK